MARKPRILVMVALTNKTTRIIWALLMKQEEYKASHSCGMSQTQTREVVGDEVGRRKVLRNSRRDGVRKPGPSTVP
jgi:hypothetical protein